MLTVGQQVSLKKAFSTLSDVKLVFKKAQDFPCMLRSFGNNNYLPSNVHRQGYRETPIRQMPKKKDNHQKKDSKSRNKDVLASGLMVQEIMDKLRKEME